MDIKSFKQLSIPKIEAGKMTEVVSCIKGVQASKQNVYEQNKGDFEPIREEIQRNLKKSVN